VLALIDGARDVRTIAAELARSEFDVAKTLFGLESAGVIVLLPAGPDAPRADAAGAGDPLGRAEAALGRRDAEGARAAAEQAVAARPQDAVAHLVLGRAHLAGGRAQPAVEALSRAVRLDPRLGPAYRVQGFALAAVGRFAEAEESWDQWERLAGRTPGESEHAQAVEQARAAARLLAGAIGRG
jgi:tetratricopeptide (TPR) repeat protein